MALTHFVNRSEPGLDHYYAKGRGPYVRTTDYRGRSKWYQVTEVIILQGRCHFYGYRYRPTKGYTFGQQPVPIRANNITACTTDTEES